MRIDNNLSAMLGASLQIQDSVANIAEVSKTVEDSQFSEFADDFAQEIVEQIPQIIAYSANAKSIEVQEVAMGTLLDIRA